MMISLFLTMIGTISHQNNFLLGFHYNAFNPQAPVAQKNADEAGFLRFQGEGVDFFNRTSLTPIRFLMRIF